MPHSFFILYRHFLRVDNVLFRIYDVRLYHQFGSDEVIREVCGMEADYELVKSVRPVWFESVHRLTLCFRGWRNPRISRR